MFSTPGESHAAIMISPSRRADNEVSSPGASTTVRPAARAGASFISVSISGEFHGTIAATTPADSRKVKLAICLPAARIRSN